MASKEAQIDWRGKYSSLEGVSSQIPYRGDVAEVINDLERTIDEVIKGSLLPISIIIVGIGLADFDQMEALDGDTAPLFSRTLKKYA